ncbi:MAG: hypothetical protein ACI4F4_03220 [Lachnospiraceae bacterium]
MTPDNGEFNNLATRVAVCKDLISEEIGNDEMVDKLLNRKDQVDKQDVLDHMEEFSCKEELERYVENYKETYHNAITEDKKGSTAWKKS